jgi:hypothetical protein
MVEVIKEKKDKMGPWGRMVSAHLLSLVFFFFFFIKA